MTVGLAGSRTGAEFRSLADDIVRCCRFPSISSDPGHRRDMQACARWLAHRYRVGPFTGVSVVQTAGHPLVVARSLRVPGRPTVLLYGHYDVQPASPTSAWRSPPFDPRFCDENIYARGASDDKGQLLVHLHAAEALVRRTGRLPVGLVVVLDGEEEIGSPNLRRWLRRNVDASACDVALVSDTRMQGPGRPSLVTGLRGSLSLDVNVSALGTELHSGTFGGAVHNPVHVLSQVLGSMHDARGRVTVDGFYDEVVELSDAERARRRSSGPTDAEFRGAAGGAALWGEAGFNAYERTTIRPALNVVGITGGHVGHGARNAVPTASSARVNIRLVRDQNPAVVARAVRRHIGRRTPDGLRSCVTVLSSTRATTVPVRHPAVLCAADALTEAFGRPPAVLFSGGTIPVAGMLQDELGVVPILMGFGLPDDNTHAPNEKVHLPTLLRGVEAVGAFLTRMGRFRAAT